MYSKISKETSSTCSSDDTLFILGLILVVLGLYAIAEWPLSSGLLVFSLGVVIMSSPPERIKDAFSFFLSSLEVAGRRLSGLFHPISIESETKS